MFFKNCLYTILLKNKNLEGFDFRQEGSDKKNLLDHWIQFDADFPYSIESRSQYEKIVIIPVLKYIIKNHQVSSLTHYFQSGLNPKHKTLNSLIMFNYLNSFEFCLDEISSLHFHDIIQVWLARKLIRLPSIENTLISLIMKLYKKNGKIKDKKSCAFLKLLIDLPSRKTNIISKYKEELQKNKRLKDTFLEDKNDAFNTYIENNYLPKDSIYQDYYNSYLEEDYNYLQRCKKFEKLFRKISTQSITII